MCMGQIATLGKAKAAAGTHRDCSWKLYGGDANVDDNTYSMAQQQFAVAEKVLLLYLISYNYNLRNVPHLKFDSL